MTDEQEHSWGSEEARRALEEQRARLQAATARLRARLEAALPPKAQSEPQPAPPQPNAPSASPAPDRDAHRFGLSAMPAIASSQAAARILERAHQIAREQAAEQEHTPAHPAEQTAPATPSDVEAPQRTAEPPPVDRQPSPLDALAQSTLARERPPSTPHSELAVSEPAVPATAPPPAAPAVSPSRSLRSTPPWLARALREMASQDPQSAGRLLLALLPAHGLVEPARNLSYDLDIEQVGCLAVTLHRGDVQISEQPQPRPAGEVDFQISASLEGLGILLAGGRTRRLLARDRARVTPVRASIETLRSLAQAPLGLRALHSVGVRLDPMLAYRSLALSIEPQWTAAHRFTLLHEVEGSPGHRCCVYVDGERPVSVLSPSRHTHASVTVICRPEQFLPLLAGDLTSAQEQRLLHGDTDAFATFQDWIARIEWAGAYGG